MLMTDLWEALDYTNKEPPVHLLMRPVAQFFGFKFSDPSKTEQPSSEETSSGKNPSPQKLAPVLAIAGKSRGNAPNYIRNSKAMQKMFEDMKVEDAG